MLLHMKTSYQKILRSLGTLFSVIVAIVILYFSLSSHGGVPGLEISDKSGHFLAYTAFSFSLFFAFSSLPEGETGVKVLSRNGRSYLLSLVIGMALGIFVEIVQPYVGRSRELADALADLLGILLGLLVASLALLLLLAVKGGKDGRL